MNSGKLIISTILAYNHATSSTEPSSNDLSRLIKPISKLSFLILRDLFPDLFQEYLCIFTFLAWASYMQSRIAKRIMQAEQLLAA